ncbi:hypothetical protein KP07_02140 [Candidatus Liberibacter solanacearum]|nr:hypothetical protein [Candidatus Liberibacter solanacearum]KJZ80698.1 hypothetical protein KP07_02140 [Candidatus Liberibacter solanacearum]
MMMMTIKPPLLSFLSKWIKKVEQSSSSNQPLSPANTNPTTSEDQNNKIPLTPNVAIPAPIDKKVEQSSSSNQPLSPANTNPTTSEDQSKSETSSSSPDSPEEKSTPSSEHLAILS